MYLRNFLVLFSYTFLLLPSGVLSKFWLFLIFVSVHFFFEYKGKFFLALTFWSLVEVLAVFLYFYHCISFVNIRVSFSNLKNNVLIQTL